MYPASIWSNKSQAKQTLSQYVSLTTPLLSHILSSICKYTTITCLNKTKTSEYDQDSLEHRLRPIKTISVFRVTELKILYRVGTHIFPGKKYIILKGISLEKSII